jgi:hypothetical protein
VKPSEDPLLEVYELYDTILSQLIQNFPTTHFILATGLHQEPHAEVTYYWRLVQHESFLRQIDVPFETVEPRMSRDFLIKCRDAHQAVSAAQRLALATANGLPLFEIDNRGTDLFVMLTYPREICLGFEFSIGNENFNTLYKDVAFVAIKNGKHDGMGYFVYTATSAAVSPVVIPLTALPERIKAALSC